MNRVVSYTYDSWGNILAVSDTTGLNVGSLNPFRYRGYMYDEETGLYYLNSQYYDPYVGRFINADGFVSTGQGFIGYNMFAYCLNNPVNMNDKNGNLPSFNEIKDKVLNKKSNLEGYTITNLIQARSREIYIEIVKSFDVENNYLKRKNSEGITITYCNYFARDVMEKVGNILPGGRANNMYDVLTRGYNGWIEVDSATIAWEHANNGYSSIAIWKNPNGAHGHIQVVIPSISIETAIAQAGAENYYGGSFMEARGTKYYVNYNMVKGDWS